MIVSNFVSKRARDITNITDKSYLLKEINCNKLFYNSTDQNKFDKNFDWNKSIKYKFIENNYNTHQNAIRQLYSVKKVTQMWENNNVKYDYYLYLRPDLIYINKLDVKFILNNLINNNCLGTPYWHKWSGLNDRIYMGNKNIISIFGNRLDYLENYINERKIYYHPEIFMKYIAEKNKIKIIDINLKGNRVRSNGNIKNENFSL